MHEVTLLVNIAVALVAAFIGGIVARRLRLPSIIGYLLAGILIGPFTPGFVGDTATIGQLAELGVIFLMFGVGLHFSLRDLWRVRAIAIPGALGQTALATLAGFGLSRLWGWAPSAGIVLGLAVSVASTVVLLRGLLDNDLLSTSRGQAALGWLVLEDLLTVLILVLLPILAGGTGGFDWGRLGLTLLKAAAFVLVALLLGIRLVPWLLLRVARTRSRELFILAIVAIALGIALGAAELFGVSLALGAFVAGVVVSESPLSHQVGADVLPFRETFAVLFFVSVGMLVNPRYLVEHLALVLALTALVMLGKPLITLILGLLFRWPARTVLVIAAGLSQIGEFSFILGQAGVSLGLLDADQYSLLLACSLISITLNPAMFRLTGPLERLLQRRPALWRWLNRQERETEAPSAAPLPTSGHVVIVGYGRVGHHIAVLLDEMEMPYLVVYADPGQVEELRRHGVPGILGDAANPEILTAAGLDGARVLVVAGPDESASEQVVATARGLAPDLPIIARASTREGLERLTRFGAQYVIHPELEGGLEIVRHTLLQLGFPLQEICRYTDAVRHEHYDLEIDTEEEHRLLHGLIEAADRIEISWVRLPPGNAAVGQTLAEANLRARTGASVVAILRNGQLLANPGPAAVLEEGDRIGLIGEKEQREAVEQLLGGSASAEA